MRIFVTGGTGFIGSHFLKAALAAGHEVRAIRRSGARPRLELSTEPAWVEGTLETVPVEALRGCDVLVHFAAAGVLSGTASWEECFRWNVTASMRLWLLAADQGVKHVIVSGSCYEYGRVAERYERIPVTAPLEPNGAYHSSKAAATMAALGIAADRNIAFSILRPFNVFGEGESETRVWPALRAAALAGQDFPMTKGEQVRDFIEVEEVARRFFAAAVAPPVMGRPIIKNVGTGHPQTIRNFAEYWWKCWGAKGRLQVGALPYRPKEIMRYVPEIEPENG